MSGFEPSLPSFCAFCSFFLGGGGGLTIAAAPILLFFTPYPNYTCSWLFKLPNVWRTYFLAASLSPKILRKIQVTSVQP